MAISTLNGTAFGTNQIITANGIQFPATQVTSSNANTLDDYEEGTWTPTDVSGAGLTFTVNSANYVKVGKIVFINVYLQYPGTSDATPAQIGGLPFQAAGGNTYSYFYGRNNSGANVVWQVGANTTSALANNPAQAGNPTNASLSSSYILISGCYNSAN